MKILTSAVLLAASAVMFNASAADKLNVKTGLWEIRSESTIGGLPPVPKEVLDKMTPEARKQMEAAFRQNAAAGPEVDVDRDCITQRDIERPFETADAEECKHTIVNTTRTSQEIQLSCTGKVKGSGVFRINTPTPETMNGTLDLRVGEGPDAMTVKSRVEGRWLGPDCGDEDEIDDDAQSDEDELDTEEEEE